MLKFIVRDKLIIMDGEEDILVSHLSSFKYIEANGKTLKTSFQALEVVVISRKDDTQKDIPTPSCGKFSTMIKRGGPVSWGKVVEILDKKDRFRLGYEP